jgi:hypothetical protein
VAGSAACGRRRRAPLVRATSRRRVRRTGAQPAAAAKAGLRLRGGGRRRRAEATGRLGAGRDGDGTATAAAAVGCSGTRSPSAPDRRCGCRTAAGWAERGADRVCRSSRRRMSSGVLRAQGREGRSAGREGRRPLGPARCRRQGRW